MSTAGDGEVLVTAEFQLRYRRPVPIETPLTIRGHLLSSEGRDFFLEGVIVDARGDELTRATSRWRRVG
jgi:acyl-CoA thioesterase FadM